MNPQSKKLISKFSNKNKAFVIQIDVKIFEEILSPPNFDFQNISDTMKVLQDIKDFRNTKVDVSILFNHSLRNPDTFAIVFQGGDHQTNNDNLIGDIQHIDTLQMCQFLDLCESKVFNLKMITFKDYVNNGEFFI